MAMSACYSSYYRSDSLGVVTDVADIIVGIREALVNSPPAASKWTEPSADKFVSPLRSDGISISFTVSALSATRLSYVVLDENGVQVNAATDTRQDIAAAGNSVSIYSGPFYCVVDSLRATPETWCCGIAERSPEINSIPRATYFASIGPRNTAGSLNANEWGEFWVLPPNAFAYNGTSGRRHVMAGKLPASSGTCTFDRYTITGGMMAWTLELVYDKWWLGRFPQAIMAPHSLLVGDIVTFPVDEVGTVGSFKIVGFPPDGYGYNKARIGLRIG